VTAVAGLDAFLRDAARTCDALLGPGAGRRGGDVDRVVEAALIELVGRRLGEATILSEEAFSATGREIDPGRRLRVLLDPLDGSRNYVRGSQVYATSIAFELDGELVAGWIYRPSSRTSWLALRGAGAYANGRRLPPAPSTRSGVVSMKSTLVDVPPYAAVVEALGARGYRVVRLGATSLKLCRCAVGRHAGVVKQVETTNGLTRIWGVAAGVVLCREVGIRVADLGGSEWQHRASTSIVAATEDVHAAVAASPRDAGVGQPPTARA
jgi:myo-inositol-1(or 4)-monophosphatase